MGRQLPVVKVLDFVTRQVAMLTRTAEFGQDRSLTLPFKTTSSSVVDCTGSVWQGVIRLIIITTRPWPCSDGRIRNPNRKVSRRSDHGR